MIFEHKWDPHKRRFMALQLTPSREILSFWVFVSHHRTFTTTFVKLRNWILWLLSLRLFLNGLKAFLEPENRAEHVVALHENHPCALRKCRELCTCPSQIVTELPARLVVLERTRRFVLVVCSRSTKHAGRNFLNSRSSLENPPFACSLDSYTVSTAFKRWILSTSSGVQEPILRNYQTEGGKCRQKVLRSQLRWFRWAFNLSFRGIKFHFARLRYHCCNLEELYSDRLNVICNTTVAMNFSQGQDWYCFSLNISNFHTSCAHVLIAVSIFPDLRLPLIQTTWDRKTKTDRKRNVNHHRRVLRSDPVMCAGNWWRHDVQGQDGRGRSDLLYITLHGRHHQSKVGRSCPPPFCGQEDSACQSLDPSPKISGYDSARHCKRQTFWLASKLDRRYFSFWLTILSFYRQENATFCSCLGTVYSPKGSFQNSTNWQGLASCEIWIAPSWVLPKKVWQDPSCFTVFLTPELKIWLVVGDVTPVSYSDSDVALNKEPLIKFQVCLMIPLRSSNKTCTSEK